MSVEELKVGDPVTMLNGVLTPANAVVLATSSGIKGMIETLAEDIRPWIDSDASRPVVIVALLEGGRFYADCLTAELRKNCIVAFTRHDIKVSTRNGDGRPLESHRIVGDLEVLRGGRILIVDDVLDSGATLSVVYQCLEGIVSELKSTVLVQKNDPNFGAAKLSARPKVDFVGMIFEDSRWLSGAGMDMPGDSDGRAQNSSMLIAYPPVF